MKQKRYKRLSCILALCMLFTMFQAPLGVLAAPAEPSASQRGLAQSDGYIMIETPEDLAQVMNDTAAYAGEKLKLTGPIDMTGQTVEPLGNGTTPFSGTFDGGGFTISNLTITSGTGYTGMFGQVTGTVENVVLDQCAITDTNESYTKGIGGLAGYNKGTVTNCILTNSSVTTSYSYLGGLIGYNEGTVAGCGVEASSVTAASVATMAYAGGFTGCNGANGQISLSYVLGGTVAFTGAEAKGQEIGGFAGRNAAANSKISQCYSTSQVTSAGDKAGGFIGNANNGSIENCFSTGNVTGRKYVGGFAADLGYGDCSLTACYTAGNVVSTGTSSGKFNYFGPFYGNGMFPSATKCYYLSSTSVTGNGTIAEQDSAFMGKSSDELKDASLLGGAWTADGSHNNGYPYLSGVKAPGSGGSEPSGPVQLETPAGLSWNGAEASWTQVPNAASYTVYLYQKQVSGGDTLVETYEGLTAASKDFTEIIVHSGDYYITVQAIGDGTSYTDSAVSAQSPAYHYINRDESGYILIETADELLTLAKSDADLTQNYKLANNIDMTGKTGKVIGKYNNGASGEKAFTGIFDGDGHQITNLSLAGEALFSYVGETGIIRNVTLANGEIEDSASNSSHYPAALVSLNKGTVENCFSKNTTVVSQYNACTGGLVGRNDGTVRLSGVDGGSVVCKSAYSTKIGGLIGRNLGGVDQCFSSASVSGAKWVGGLIGGQEGGTVSNCYAVGQVTATGEQAGGLVGFFITYDRDNPSVLQNAYASNNVQALSGGPIAGGNATVAKDGEATAANCYYNVYKTAPETEGMALSSAVGKTTGQMKTQEFAQHLGGSDIWAVDGSQGAKVVNNGYPYLTKAAPAPADASDEPIQVEILIAAYDGDSYQFDPSSAMAVQASGEPVTVKDVLDAAHAKGLLRYEAEQSSSTGYFVKSINGITPESPSGWMFTINDKKSSVGVSAAQVYPGDKILWYEGTPANHFTAPSWEDMTSPEAPDFVEISSKEQLLALANSADPATDWAKNYRLTADIDLSGETYSPIGSDQIPFSGIFDGNGRTVSNLAITKGAGSQNLGFFGCIQGATILNLTIEDAQITGGSRLGVLAGVAKADPAKGTANLIGGCRATGALNALGTSVIKQTDAGGLVGINEGGTDSGSGQSAYSAIDHSSADVLVTASTGSADTAESGHVGGLVGWNKGIVTNSFAEGNVNGGNTTGGFVGSNFGSIYLSHSTGHVTAGYTAGGFAGSSGMGSEVENCYSTGNVIAITPNSGAYFGGFAGSITGKVKNCVSTGTLTPGWSYNGGFAGYFEGTLYSFNENFVTLKNCFGNSETSLGTTIKALGNYLNGRDEKADQAAASVGVTKEKSEEKLEEMLHAVAQQEADAEALRREAAKYQTQVTIPNTVQEQTDITALIAQLKPGESADQNIVVQYREREENQFITSGSPANRYTLAQRNTQAGKVTEEVVLLFTQNGQAYAQTVTVDIQGTPTQATMEDLLAGLAKRYANPSYEGSLSDWIALDLGAYLGKDKSFSSPGAKNLFLADSLANVNSRYPTDLQRAALMMTAQGVDASEYINQIAMLSADAMDSVNAQAFALLAYDSGSYTLPQNALNTRNSVIAYLLSHQNTDGGWAYSAATSEASMTAMVLSALAPYRNQPQVEAAVQDGIACLSSLQRPSGGFAYDGAENSNDAAMVVIALTSLGIDAGSDPAFVKNGSSVLSNLLSFVTADLQFGYDSSAQADAIATEQGFRALIAYSRYQETGYHLYQFAGELSPQVKPGKVTVTVQQDEGLSVFQWPSEDLLKQAALTNEDWEKIGIGADAQIHFHLTKADSQHAGQLKALLEENEILAYSWKLAAEKTVGGETTQITKFQAPIEITAALPKDAQNQSPYLFLSLSGNRTTLLNQGEASDSLALEIAQTGWFGLGWSTGNQSQPEANQPLKTGDSAPVLWVASLSLLSCLALLELKRRKIHKIV